MSRTVMIVDDSLFMRKILRGILVEKGYTVIAEAASGIEAMKNLHTHHPDIILLDIILPDSNGLEPAGMDYQLLPELKDRCLLFDRTAAGHTKSARSWRQGIYPETVYPRKNS